MNLGYCASCKQLWMLQRASLLIFIMSSKLEWMRLFNNSNASLILAIFNNLGSKNERVSATTENAPVYNVMQLAFKKYKWLQRISNYGNLKVQSVLLKLWRASRYRLGCLTGKQQWSTIFNSNTNCNYEEDANSSHNTMSISLQKYFVNVRLKTLVQEAFKAAEFFSSNSCFAPITTRIQMSISSKNHLYATHHTMSNSLIPTTKTQSFLVHLANNFECYKEHSCSFLSHHQHWNEWGYSTTLMPHWF